MPDPNFKIKIETESNTAPISKTTKEFTSLATEAGKAGVKVDDISDKVGKRLAPAAIAAAIAAGLAFRGLSWFLRIVSVAFGDAGKEVNRLADNLGKMASRGNVAAAALTTGLSALNEWIETSQVSFDHLATNIGKAEDKFKDATAAAGAFAEKEKEAKNEADDLAEALERQVTAVQNRADQTVAVLEAQKANERARAEAEENDPEKKSRRLAGIDASFDGAILNAKIAAGGDQARILRSGIDANTRRAAEAQENIPDAASVAKLVEAATASLSRIDTARVANREAFLDSEALAAVRRGDNNGNQFRRSMFLEAEAGSKDAAESRAALQLQATRQELADAEQGRRQAFMVLPEKPEVLLAPGGVQSFVEGRQALANQVLSESARANAGLQTRLNEVEGKTATAQQIGRIGANTQRLEANTRIGEVVEQNGGRVTSGLRQLDSRSQSSDEAVKLIERLIRRDEARGRRISQLEADFRRLESSQ